MHLIKTVVMKTLASLLAAACLGLVPYVTYVQYNQGKLSGNPLESFIPIVMSLGLGIVALAYVFNFRWTDFSFDDLAKLKKFDFGPLPVGDDYTEAHATGMWTIVLIYGAMPAIGIALWFLYSSLGITISTSDIAKGFLLSLIFLPLHEAVHRFSLPPKVRSTARIALELRMGMAFCVFSGEMNRRHMIRTALMPFAVLSVIPFALSLTVFQSPLLAAFVLVHTTQCAGDFYAAAWTYRTVGPQQKVFQHGARTYLADSASQI